MTTVMTCRDSVNHLMEYVDQRLGTRKRRALENHLKICPRCTEFLDSYRSMIRILREATDVRLPEAAAKRLWRAIATGRRI